MKNKPNILCSKKDSSLSDSVRAKKVPISCSVEFLENL